MFDYRKPIAFNAVFVICFLVAGAMGTLELLWTGHPTFIPAVWAVCLPSICVGIVWIVRWCLWWDEDWRKWERRDG
jgi:hypothetical protein